MKTTTFARLIAGAVFLLVLAVAPSVRAAFTIGLWTFENGQPSALPSNWTSTSGFTGTSWSGLSSDVGTGTGGGVLASASALWTAPAGDGSARSFSANHWGVGDYYFFRVNVPSAYSGLGPIAVSYDQNGSSTGPGHWSLQYSTDGLNFTGLPDYTLASGVSWSSATPNNPTHLSFDLGSVSGLNTAPILYFRVVDDNTTAVNGGTVVTGGTDQLDNFRVNIPEPANLSLLGGFGLLAWTLIRRRK